MAKARRPRSDRGLVSLSLLLFAVSVITALTSGLGAADTAGAPDTNTKAAISPATPNLDPPGPITGAVEGTTIAIHVDGSAGKFFGVNAARLCRSGLAITTSSQMSPTSFGNCIAQPFADTDDAIVGPVSASPTNTSVDFVFRVGSGTEATHPGPGNAITCGVANPCALWLWESVDTSITKTGNVFKHFDIQYAGDGSTTTSSTTTSSTSTSTSSTTSTTTTSTSSTSTTTTTAPTTTTASSTTTTAPTSTTLASSSTTTQPETTDTMVAPQTATPGGTIAINSAGWAPGTDVTVVLHSDPITLGTLKAAANGAVSGDVVIPADIEAGTHTLELTGAALDGGARTLNATLTIATTSSVSGVSASETSQPPLARTGVESLRMFWSGTSFLGAGALLVIAAKRRRSQPQ